MKDLSAMMAEVQRDEALHARLAPFIEDPLCHKSFLSRLSSIAGRVLTTYLKFPHTSTEHQSLLGSIPFWEAALPV